uniref:Thymocyte selection associated family member 2 n=1 Tax=Sinocyclocheilus grahami TaxID=75366 RepID=A0A672S904_SINGR
MAAGSLRPQTGHEVLIFFFFSLSLWFTLCILKHDDVFFFLSGSIYELSGSEVCLSTGDLLKIIGLELLSVSCEEIETGASFELPTGYSGEPLNNSKQVCWGRLELNSSGHWLSRCRIGHPNHRGLMHGNGLGINICSRLNFYIYIHLEVEVQDVTEQFQDLVFITPLSMTEVASQPMESFPTMAEILESPEGNTFFNCSWFEELQRGRRLVLHSYGTTTMILASTPKGRKGKQYFIISESYGGRMRRRAREFGSVYELHLASSQSPGLKVSVTRHCEAVEEEGMPALSVGEQLEVLGMALMDGLKDSSGAAQKIESLICKQTMELDDEDEEDEEDDSKEISLPLFMAGHFVEKLSDNKKYKLTDLASSSLPLDIKVMTRDKELEKDPLMGLPALKLEETFTETTVLTSLPNKPDWCFELPVRWLQMSLCFTSDHLPWSSNESPELHVETVTEVTEKFYYEYHKLISKIEEPPPRPPKRKPASSEVPKKSPKSESKLSNLSIVRQNSQHALCYTMKATGDGRCQPPMTKHHGSTIHAGCSNCQILGIM